MNEFKIITCCNRIPQEPYYCLNEFVKSLGESEKDLIVLDERMGKWDGLGTKPKWLYQALKSGMVDTPYVIFTDCWDMVFTRNPELIIDRFVYSFRSDLVISCEKNCFPADLKDEYDALNPPTSYKYLNSGMIVGKTEALLKALEAMDLQNVPDDYRKEDGNMEHINDQFLWQQLFLKQPVKIALDYKQQLCQTMHDVSIDELDFTGAKIRNIETDSYPLAIHMNGGSKTSGVREPILKHLNLLQMKKVTVLYNGIEYLLSNDDISELPSIWRLLIKQLWKEKIVNHICIKCEKL